jgi:site-specific recombinase XerD
VSAREAQREAADAKTLAKIRGLIEDMDRESGMLWNEYDRHLRGKHVRVNTRWAYAWSMTCLMRAARCPIEDIDAGDIRDYVGGLPNRSTADTRYRHFRAFFRWAEAERVWEPGASPIVGVEAPQMADELIEAVTPDEIKAILATCRSGSFEDVRDEAIIRCLASPAGPRAGELAGWDVKDVDLTRDVASILDGKWARDRLAPFGPDCGRALSRYVRARKRHRLAGKTEAFWLGRSGPITRSGLQFIVDSRAKAAGITRKLHPHMWRHYVAIQHKRNKTDPALGMALMGWESEAMWRKYGRAATGMLAVEAGHAMAETLERSI